ncbi:restriction endonuclease subunit S [Thiomonas sp.]|jgi:type I restriction enzyme S subunit|uniref:restriction endonuclease subunit S n=1 Tax=Thiomonas sp. TaxID=2047785 RepID=UPI000A5A0D90|nr:restriction endonuclease subunit S [Thiomonas sp.]
MSSETKANAAKDEARPARVPKLRFPEFRGAEGWKPVTLQQASTPVTERVGERKLTPVSISAGIGFVPQAEKFGRDISGNQYQIYTLVSDGDFVYNKGNSLKFPQGCVYQLQGWGQVAAPNVFICFRLKDGYSNVFFQNCFEQNMHGKQIKKHITSGARSNGLLNISKENFFGVEIHTPSLAEQQKIAECLSSVDELMAAQARKVGALKTHKKGLMQQLFPTEGETQPRLRFPEFENAGDWAEKKLGSVCNIQRGKFSHRPRNDPRFFGGPYPFIQTGDVVKSEGGAVIASQSLNEEGLAVSKLFKPTIVLITIAANIGDTGLLQTDGCFTDSVVGLIPGKDVIPVFLELIMRGQKENLNKVATTGAQKNINNEILREVCVLLPSLPEQHRIASCLSSLDALITAETQKLDALKTHKQGLMQQLFPSPEALEA